MNKYLAEFIGTFALVFIGTGAIIVDQQTNGSLGLVGIALAFGGVVSAMIYMIGPISGSHINPVVTISLALGKLIPKKEVSGYLLAQFSGAILASSVLLLIFPANESLGATLPRGSSLESFITEVVCTFLLMFVILVVSNKKELSSLTGLIVGVFLIGLIMVSGPISGGSFNPARSLGPALLTGNLSALWIYLSATTLGAVLAIPAWRTLSATDKNLMP